MTFIASLMGTVLIALAALHAYWGFGGFWPGTDALSLSRIVGGFRKASRPSAAACFMVALALGGAAMVAFALGGISLALLPPQLLLPASIVLTFVFLGRGAAGYTAAWRRITPMQPFARLDRQCYSPLCLAVGVGFLVLIVAGLAT